MYRNRRLTWWIGLLIAVFVLTAFAPLRGETAPVAPASGEMKLQVQPDFFADRNEGYVLLWTKVKLLAMEMGIPVLEAKNPFKEGLRKIVYLDTRKGELTDKRYIVRERVKIKDGNPADAVELMLRYRVTAGEAADSEAVKTAPGFKAKISHEDDIAGFVGGLVGNNVVEVSVSHAIKDIPAADLENKTLGNYARYFPTLANLGLPLTEQLGVSKGITVREFKVAPAELDFGQGMKGEASISLWYDYSTGKAIAAEFSFECGRGPAAPAAAVAKTEAFFNALQDRLSDILLPGGSKTQLVTGEAK